MQFEDLDSGMEPFRGRSNTWPLQQVSDEVKCEVDCQPTDPLANPLMATHSSSPLNDIDQSMTSAGPKKNTSRRNAWGNMSYADLITQAINGSPDKRLTLSQIYDWMVQNVPYFKDKGDSNSSAGWKNSIRHNLSLHNRFMRVQNEGTGKSSWWMINPDAKPGKAARRRATSMETQKYEKKRGRVKKKIEALRNGLAVEQTTPSPSSSVSEGLDMFPDSPLHHGFQLSPEFRPRASSNASSCGRLSPIPAVDNDMHDSQVPPLSPLNNWYGSNLTEVSDQFGTSDQQLVDLANLNLGANNTFLTVNKTSPSGQLSPAGSNVQLNQYNGVTNFGSIQQFNSAPNGSPNSSDTIFLSQPNSETGATTLTALKNVCGAHSPSRLLSNTDPYRPNGSYSLASLSPVLSSQGKSMAAVTPASSASVTSLGTTATQVMGHLLSLNNQCLPNDLDLNLDSLQGGLECDVDSVIRHELSVEGSLDFNFDSCLHHGSSAAFLAQAQAQARGRHHGEPLC